LMEPRYEAVFTFRLGKFGRMTKTTSIRGFWLKPALTDSGLASR